MDGISELIDCVERNNPYKTIYSYLLLGWTIRDGEFFCNIVLYFCNWV